MAYAGMFILSVAVTPSLSALDKKTDDPNPGGPGGNPGGNPGSPGDTSVVPEPATMILLASGMLVLGGVALRRRKHDGD